MKVDEVDVPDFNSDNSRTNTYSIDNSELQIHGSNFHSNDFPVTNNYLDNSEFGNDEECKSQIAKQRRSDRIANKPRLHHRHID